MPATMRTIKSLDTVIEMALSAHAAGDTLYVRYSTGPAADARYGNRSRNHASGDVHSGLSVNNLTTADYAPSATREWVIQQLTEYSYMLHQGLRGTRCWLLTGTECGRGADNEPLLEQVAPVAYVAPSALDEAIALHQAKADRETALRRLAERLGRHAIAAMDEQERETAIANDIDRLYGRTGA